MSKYATIPDAIIPIATIPDAIIPFEKIPDAKTKVCRLKNCFYLGAVQLLPSQLDPEPSCKHFAGYQIVNTRYQDNIVSKYQTLKYQIGQDYKSIWPVCLCFRAQQRGIFAQIYSWPSARFPHYRASIPCKQGLSIKNTLFANIQTTITYLISTMKFWDKKILVLR